MIKYQSEAEEAIRNVTYDVYIHDGDFRLVDSKLGKVSAIRLPYVSDTVKLNRAHLNHLIESLADWTESECQQARQKVTEGTELDFDLDENAPRRLENYFIFPLFIFP